MSDLFFSSDLSCTEMAELVANFKSALAKVDLILVKLEEISGLETPSSEVVQFCSTAATDLTALK